MLLLLSINDGSHTDVHQWCLTYKCLPRVQTFTTYTYFSFTVSFAFPFIGANSSFKDIPWISIFCNIEGQNAGWAFIELSEFLKHKQIYNIKILRKITEQKWIPTKKAIDKIQDGWAGKPMGLFHECWLLGLIDPNVPQSRYTTMDKKEDKDADGKFTDEGKSIVWRIFDSNIVILKWEKRNRMHTT